MSDLIDRQAAIEAIANVFSTGDADADRYTAERVLAEVPSAHPEIIYCKDCKWFDVDQHQCHRQICAVFYENDYCSYAERRTDE